MLINEEKEVQARILRVYERMLSWVWVDSCRDLVQNFGAKVHEGMQYWVCGLGA